MMNRLSNLVVDNIVDLRVAIRRPSLEVRDQDTLESLGILVEDIDYTLALDMGTPNRYFGESRFGYHYRFGFSHFGMGEQEIMVMGDPTNVDLGTSANGIFFYATPMVFYTRGDKNIIDGKGKSMKAGLGVGIGYLEAQGDIILTNAGNILHEFDIHSTPVSAAFSFLVDYRKDNWVGVFHVGGPVVKDNGYNYNLFDFSIQLGRAFQL